MPRQLAAACAALAGFLIAGGAAVGASAAEKQIAFRSNDLCAVALHRAGAGRGLPRGLLEAIALVESGRWDAERSARFAWPWTIHAEGEGRYFPSKAEAVAAVRALQARGVSNIDVGCMQVNLHFHGHRFASVDEALDPLVNARYAVAFLESLRADLGSWDAAVAHYHSATDSLNRPYRAKVYRAWRERAAGVRTARAAAASAPRAPAAGAAVPPAHAWLHARAARPNLQLLTRVRQMQLGALPPRPAPPGGIPLTYGRAGGGPPDDDDRPRLRRLDDRPGPLGARTAGAAARGHRLNPLVAGPPTKPRPASRRISFRRAEPAAAPPGAIGIGRPVPARAPDL